MAQKRTLFSWAIATSVAAVALACSTVASANDVYWSIGVSSPGIQVGVQNAPPVVYQRPVVVYQQPQVVYQQPQVIYQQPQVVYQQPQVVYQQPQVVYVQPRPVFVQPRPIYYTQPAQVYYGAPQPTYRHPHPGWHHPGGYGGQGGYRAPSGPAPVVYPLSHPYGKPFVEPRSGDRGRNHQ
jgi:hypothetical protein